MALIGEAQHALIEFESHIHMDAIRLLIGAAEKFVSGTKPDELAIEAEVQFEPAAIKREQKVFAVAGGIEDAAAAGELRELRWRLRFRGNGMKNMDAADATFANERAQTARYSFDFRKFRHAWPYAKSRSLAPLGMTT